MLAFGAALGGIVAGTWGIYPAFTIDALTFLLSALMLAQIKYQTPPELHKSEKSVSAALRQYLDGLRYLRHHVDILFISLHKGANALIVASGLQVLQVAIAEEIFVIGAGGGISLGLMFAVTGVGTGVGPIVARRFTGDESNALRNTIVLSYIITAGGLIIMAPLNSFWVLLLGNLLRGAGGGIAWVFSTQLLLQLVPNRVRGRVFATEFAIFSLLAAGGAGAVGGAMDASLGISTVLWWMMGLSLIPAVLWSLWLMIGVRAQPVSEGSS
jgi:hypothetical protein